MECMKVKELIKLLEKLDGEKEIVINADSTEFQFITEVGYYKLDDNYYIAAE